MVATDQWVKWSVHLNIPLWTFYSVQFKTTAVRFVRWECKCLQAVIKFSDSNSKRHVH